MNIVTESERTISNIIKNEQDQGERTVQQKRNSNPDTMTIFQSLDNTAGQVKEPQVHPHLTPNQSFKITIFGLF